jgi:hypothetical protein
VLRPAQIQAESQTPALTEEQVLNLLLLVRAYPPYIQAVGRYPDLAGLLEAERMTPTVKTMALKAVLTALGKLPKEVVEAQGTDKAPSFFSSTQNWGALALDTLNVLYDLPITTGPTRFVLVQPSHYDLRAPAGDYIIYV